MIKKIIAMVFICASIASAQSTKTPAIGFLIPSTGSNNWQVPLNYNFQLLDQLLSGQLPLPALTVTGPVNLPQLTISPATIAAAIGYTPLNPANNLNDVANKNLALSNLGGLSKTGGAMLGNFTAPNINGELWVDGTTYSTLNAAWNAAASAAISSGQNQTIRLGAGIFPVTSQLTEPTDGACVSLIGSAEPTITADTTLASTVITVTANLNAPLFYLDSTSTAQAQSCNFKNLMIMGNKNVTNAFNMDWFRGLYIDGVTINDTTEDAIVLGENSGSHQSNYKLQDVTISYSSAQFTPANRPNYGVHALPTAIDSEIDNLLVRNAKQAAFYNQGGGTTTFLIHGFGYPYVCKGAVNAPTTASLTSGSNSFTVNSANNWSVGMTVLGEHIPGGTTITSINGNTITISANANGNTQNSPITAVTQCNNDATSSSDPLASWASNYVIIDNGTGGNMYFDTYIDSPAISGFDIEQNGVQINGGHIQWPDLISFPQANLAQIQSNVTSNVIVSNIDCSDMAPTAGQSILGAPVADDGWITSFLTNGNYPAFSFVQGLAGCGNYYESRQSQRQTNFDIAGNNSSNSQGETPKVFVTPLSTAATEGGIEAENFANGLGDTFYSGFSGKPSNFAVHADGSVMFTGMQSSVISVSSNITLTTANHYVLANASNNSINISLPSCFTKLPDGLPVTGMEFVIEKTDTSTNAVTLTPISNESIYSLGMSYASLELNTPQTVTLACGPDYNWYASSATGGSGGGGGGGGTGITSLNGDVTSVGTPTATVTVKGINGVALNSLGAGILKQNASGVPSIAVPGTDYLTSSSNISSSQLPAFSGDVSSNAGTSSLNVTGINGVSLSSLGSGLLKVSSGTPSIAQAGTDYIAPNGNASLSALTVSSGISNNGAVTNNFTVVNDAGTNGAANYNLSTTQYGVVFESPQASHVNYNVYFPTCGGTGPNSVPIGTSYRLVAGIEGNNRDAVFAQFQPSGGVQQQLLGSNGVGQWGNYFQQGITFSYVCVGNVNGIPTWVLYGNAGITGVNGGDLADASYYNAEQINTNVVGLNGTKLTSLGAGYFYIDSNGVPHHGFANAPTMTWSSNMISVNPANQGNSDGNVWVTTYPVTITRVDSSNNFMGSGTCTTWPTWGVYDDTAKAWVATITGSAAWEHLTAQNVNVPEGHQLSVGIQTAGAGCSFGSGNINLTVTYQMQ